MRFLDIEQLEKQFEVEDGSYNELRHEDIFPYLEVKEKRIYFSNYIHHLNCESINRDNDEIERLKDFNDIFQKRFYFSAFIHSEFKETPPIIVGGSALEYYSGVQYPTGDVDLFMTESAANDLIKILRRSKFYKRGKYYYSLDKKIALEIHTGTFNGDPARLNKVKQGDREIYLIGLEDLIIDRVNIFDKKEYPEEFDWALRLFRSYHDLIDIKYLKKIFTKEGLLPYFEKLQT